MLKNMGKEIFTIYADFFCLSKPVLTTMMKRLDETGHDLKWALKCLAAQLSIIQIETGLINPDFCHSLL